MTYIPNAKTLESTVNSSTTFLTHGTTFTGTGELNNFEDVMIQVATDQNGTLYVEFSTDNTNWDTSLSFKYNTGRINPPHIFVKGPRYYRTRFTNDNVGGFDQTYFRLQTSYGSYNKLTAPINGLMSENYDALPTRPTDFTHEVGIGKRQGVTTWNKFGYNDDVDTGSEEIIASWGGTFSPITVAETISIVSTSANDIVTTGTGINAVVITGIDEDRMQQIEVVNMNGTTPVVTTSTWLGINRVAPFLCGTSETNEGTVNILGVSSGDTLAQMPIGETVSQQAIFYVQDNHTFMTTWLHINILKVSGGGGSPEVTIRGYVYSPVANAKIQIFKTKLDIAVDNTLDLKPTEPFPITEGSVLYFTAETDINNTSVDLRFSGKEQRNI